MLNYALTVHKAQGSEWPVVILSAPLRAWFEDAQDADEETTDTPLWIVILPAIPGWHDRRLVYTAL